MADYSSKIRLAIDKPCFKCLTGVTYRVIAAFEKLKVYTPEGAKQNREMFIDICQNPDSMMIRTVFFKFYWQLPDNFSGNPIHQHATLEWVLLMLEARYRLCKGKKHQSASTFKALDELGLIPSLTGEFVK